MAALKEGPVYEVTTEARTLVVDGVEVPAFHARPDGMPVAGVVLHPDVGGLRPLFEDMARRLATHGLAVCTFEPFAAASSDVRASVEARLGGVGDLDDTTQLDILSAAANLLIVADDVTQVSVLGFCMGGHYVFKAAGDDRFDRAVAFYGMLRTPDAWQGPGHRIEPLAVAAHMCPTLAIFGTNDPWTPADDIAALRQAWSGRTDCEIVEIEGGEHGFVHDPDRPIHRADDAAACWDKTVSWVTP
jgi:carboxymethylenebutenolidase